MVLRSACGGEGRLRSADTAERLRDALQAKAAEFDDVVKSGRTHLMDATPVRLGQEFGGYASQLEHGLRRLRNAAEGISAISHWSEPILNARSTPRLGTHSTVSTGALPSRTRFVSASVQPKPTRGTSASTRNARRRRTRTNQGDSAAAAKCAAMRASKQRPRVVGAERQS